jgi:hypothetical protein
LIDRQLREWGRILTIAGSSYHRARKFLLALHISSEKVFNSSPAGCLPMTYFVKRPCRLLPAVGLCFTDKDNKQSFAPPPTCNADYFTSSMRPQTHALPTHPTAHLAATPKEGGGGLAVQVKVQVGSQSLQRVQQH